MEHQIDILVFGENGVESGGSAILDRFSISRRIGRSMKLLGLGWGLALVSLPIPALHFLLVPLFFFGGLAGATFKFFDREEIKSGTANCPFCKTEMDLQKLKPFWPLPLQCSRCEKELHVQDASLPRLIQVSTR